MLFRVRFSFSVTYYIGFERDRWILSLYFLLGGLAIEDGHGINYLLSTAVLSISG